MEFAVFRSSHFSSFIDEALLEATVTIELSWHRPQPS